MKLKCKCIYPNNQPPIICDLCNIKKEFNDACGYTSVDWKGKNKKKIEWEFEIWLRSRALMIKKFDDFMGWGSR